MIHPLALATDGYLCESTLSIATNGYICIQEVPVPIPEIQYDGGGASGKPTRQVSTKDKFKDFLLEDDEEMLVILNSFLQCQN